MPRTGTASPTSCVCWKDDSANKNAALGAAFFVVTCGGSATAQSLLQDGHHARGGIGIALGADHAAGTRRRDADGDRSLHGFAPGAVEHAMEEPAFRLLGDSGVHRNLIGMRSIIMSRD